MENKPVTPAAQALAPAVSEIRALLKTSRKSIAQQVNQELLSTYWKIGEVIVRYEQNDSVRAAYGEKTAYQGTGEGFFSLEYLQYAAVLPQLSNFPVSDWKIELDALLRAAVHL